MKTSIFLTWVTIWPTNLQVSVPTSFLMYYSFIICINGFFHLSPAPAKPEVPKEPQAAAAAAAANTPAEVVAEADDDDDDVPIFG